MTCQWCDAIKPNPHGMCAECHRFPSGPRTPVPADDNTDPDGFAEYLQEESE